MDATLTREELIEAIPHRFREMMEARNRQPAPHPWLELDLTMTQLKVLFALDVQGASRPSAIATSVGTTAASVTGVLDRLESGGYVERQADASDRRALLVQLTESGAHLVSELRMSGQHQLREVLTEMSDNDLEALHRGVTALTDAARARLGEQPPERSSALGR